MMAKKQETYEEREARRGGENEVMGSENAMRAQRRMQQMDRQQTQQMKRPVPRKIKR